MKKTMITQNPVTPRSENKSRKILLSVGIIAFVLMLITAATLAAFFSDTVADSGDVKTGTQIFSSQIQCARNVRPEL